MNDFRMGRHEEAIRVLQVDMTDVKLDTRKILVLLSERKGERTALLKVGAVVGAVSGSAMTLLGKIIMVKLGLHA